MNEFQEIIARIWRNTWLCWAAADNKRRIVHARMTEVQGEIDALPPGEAQDAKRNERLQWNELLIRCRWAARFLKQAMKPEIAKTFELAGGDPTTLPEWVGLRLRTPESFTAEIPDIDKLLEASFRPNDQALREKTVPYTVQIDRIYQAIITDSYKAGGMGATLDVRVQELRVLPEYAAVAEAFDCWDTFITEGIAYLEWGRNCFAIAEASLDRLFLQYQGRFAEENDQALKLKYVQNTERTIKAVGGLYALNAELLTDESKALREPDAVEFRPLT